MTNSNFENVQVKKDVRATNNYDRSNNRGKFGGNKVSSGFRIRLSDNEIKAARTIQENFQLKSIVAVLGFSVRTLSELIKDNDLKELVSKYSQNNKNTSHRFRTTNKNETINDKRPDPFERPSISKPIEVNDLKAEDIDG